MNLSQKRHFHNLGTHVVCSLFICSSSNIWGICCIINVNFVTSFLRKHVSTSKVCLGIYKETLVIGIANLKSEVCWRVNSVRG